jgi:hypothetical protein
VQEKEDVFNAVFPKCLIMIKLSDLWEIKDCVFFLRADGDFVKATCYENNLLWDIEYIVERGRK